MDEKKPTCYFCAKQADVCGELDLCYGCSLALNRIRNYKKREDASILLFIKTAMQAILWIARGRK